MVSTTDKKNLFSVKINKKKWIYGTNFLNVYKSTLVKIITKLGLDYFKCSRISIFIIIESVQS